MASTQCQATPADGDTGAAAPVATHIDESEDVDCSERCSDCDTTNDYEALAAAQTWDNEPRIARDRVVERL